jgi:plastocyanin
MDRPAPTTGSTVDISIGDCVFLPTVAYVPVGATVEWRNTSAQSHEVVGANLTWGAHDKLLGNGDTIGWTFDQPGVYAYTCMLHPGMSGALVVGGTAGTSDSPAAAAGGAATTAGGPSATVGTASGSMPQIAIFATAGGAALAVLAMAVVLRRRTRPGA